MLFCLLLCVWLIPVHGTEQDYEKTVTVTVEDSSVYFVTFVVLGPVEGSEITFDNLTDDTVQQALYQLETETVTPNGPKSFSFVLKIPSDAPRGMYYYRTIQTSAEGRTISEDTQKIYMAAEGELETALKEIHAATGDEILNKLDEYIIEKEIIIGNDLSALEEARLLEDFEVLFENIRQEKYPTAFASLKELNDTLSLVVLMDALNTGDETEVLEKMDLYNSVIGEETQGYAFSGREGESLEDMRQEFAKEFVQLRDGVQTSLFEQTKKIRTALGLTYINSGTLKEKADALEEYAQEFSIDLTLAEKNDVTLVEVVQQMTGASSTSEAANAFETAVKLAAENKKGDEGGRGGGSGGSSSRSGGGQSFPVSTGPTTQPVPVPELENQEDTAVFSDLYDCEWAAADITALYEKKIISGDQGKFYPNQQITRAEFTKLLVLASEISTNAQGVEFTDCLKDDWFYPYVSAAYAYGFVTGRDDGTFGAQDEISRQDMAVMIYRACQSKGALTDQTQDFNFADSEEISPYAHQAMMSLAQSGIINGFEDGTVRPQTGTTRAQAAVIISRLINLFDSGADLQDAQ